MYKGNIMKSDRKSVVKSVAPIIGGAFGPIGSAAASIVSQVLLGKPDGTEEELAIAVKNMTPEQRVKLRQADYDFKIRQQELVNESEQYGIESITDRHKSDISSDSWLSKNIRPLALMFVTVSIILLAFTTIFSNLEKGQLAALSVWTGVLMPVWMTIIGFYFGSRGIEKVTNMIAKIKGVG